MTKEARSDSMARSMIKIFQRYRLYLNQGNSMDNDYRRNQVQRPLKLSKHRHRHLNSTVRHEVGVVVAITEAIVVVVGVNRITDQQMLADAAVVVEHPVPMADCLIDLLSWPARLIDGSKKVPFWLN